MVAVADCLFVQWVTDPLLSDVGDREYTVLLLKLLLPIVYQKRLGILGLVDLVIAIQHRPHH